MVSARGWTEHSAMERKGNLAQERYYFEECVSQGRAFQAEGQHGGLR